MCLPCVAAGELDLSWLWGCHELCCLVAQLLAIYTQSPHDQYSLQASKWNTKRNSYSSIKGPKMFIMLFQKNITCVCCVKSPSWSSVSFSFAALGTMSTPRYKCILSNCSVIAKLQVTDVWQQKYLCQHDKILHKRFLHKRKNNIIILINILIKIIRKSEIWAAIEHNRLHQIFKEYDMYVLRPL